MKKIAICLNIDEKSFEKLARVKDVISLEGHELTLLHVWDHTAYDFPGDMIVAFYPNEEQAKEIEAQMKSKLEALSGIFDGAGLAKFNTCVFSSATQKNDTVEFIKNYGVDLLICITPEKGMVKDFFHSSFTNYMSSHAPCDVLALR